MVAILIMILLSLILVMIAFSSTSRSTPQLIAYSSVIEPDERIPTKKIKTQIQRQPAAPSTNVSRVIASQTHSPVAVQVPEFDVQNTTPYFGDGSNYGDGWDSGNGSSANNTLNTIPQELNKRCSPQERIDRLIKGGGNLACEKAVIRSLDWLKETQGADGSWESNSQYPIGMTGLALIAFLGHCETAQSQDYGETVFNAITFLVNHALENNGRLGHDFTNKHWIYEHAIATYALAEAYTLCVLSFGEHFDQLDQTVMQAGQLIINNQHNGGGWDYGYAENSSRGGDTSIVGWQLQALKACEFTRLDFQNLKRSVRDGLNYLKKLQSNDGTFGYTSKSYLGNGTGTTAVGALCFQIWKGVNNRHSRRACEFLEKNIKLDWETDSDLYAHYYAMQAMINHGGESWERYNHMVRDEVLANQNPDGSFRPAGKNAVGWQNSVHYRTCLATLILESYYRYLPGTGQPQ